jgi:hypothetical protein
MNMRILLVLLGTSVLTFGQGLGGSGVGSDLSRRCSLYTLAVSGLNFTVNGASAVARDADTSQDFQLLTLPAKSKITGLTISPTASFVGTGLQKLTFSLGYALSSVVKDATIYAPAFRVHAPIVSGNVTTDGSGVMTVTTAAAHNLYVGDRFALSACTTAGLNGEWPIATTPTTTTLTVSGTGQNNATDGTCAMSTVINQKDATTTNGWYDDGGHFSQYRGAHQLNLRVDSVGANLSALSAGSAGVTVCYTVLP